MQIVIHEKFCKGCGLCQVTCPQKTLGVSKQLNELGYFPVSLISDEQCNRCGLCTLICPDLVIEILPEAG